MRGDARTRTRHPRRERTTGRRARPIPCWTNGRAGSHTGGRPSRSQSSLDIREPWGAWKSVGTPSPPWFVADSAVRACSCPGRPIGTRPARTGDTSGEKTRGCCWSCTTCGCGSTNRCCGSADMAWGCGMGMIWVRGCRKSPPPCWRMPGGERGWSCWTNCGCGCGCKP